MFVINFVNDENKYQNLLRIFLTKQGNQNQAIFFKSQLIPRSSVLFTKQNQFQFTNFIQNYKGLTNLDSKNNNYLLLSKQELFKKFRKYEDILMKALDRIDFQDFYIPNVKQTSLYAFKENKHFTIETVEIKQIAIHSNQPQNQNSVWRLL